MGFKDEGFKEFTRTSGTLKAQFEGEDQQVDYKAVNFINSAGTIGYAEVDANNIVGFIFLSRTRSGDILTFPGEGTGPLPFQIDGYKALTTIAQDSPVEVFYEEHKKASMGAEIMSDEAILKEEVLRLPQRTVELAMKVFETMVASMDVAMDQFAETMGGKAEDVKVTRSCPACGGATPGSEDTCPECGAKLN